MFVVDFCAFILHLWQIFYQGAFLHKMCTYFLAVLAASILRL